MVLCNCWCKTLSCQGYTLGPRPFLMKINNMRHIYLCKCILKIFIAWSYSSHPWLWLAYVKSWFAFIRTIEIKGLCLQLKRSGTEYAAQKINFLTSAVANGGSVPLWKVSLGSNEVLMSYYLFIFSSHHYVQHKFYWFWLIFWLIFWSLFDLKLLFFKPL